MSSASTSKKHLFAVHYEGFSDRIKTGAIMVLDDEHLMHRIVRVLRLKPDENLILFDKKNHYQVTLVAVSKKNISVRVDSSQSNNQYLPEITVFLPVLKRDDLDVAIYGLVETGVTSIQLIETPRSWGGSRERERIERVISAAAEQSKQYATPTLSDPISLEQAVKKATATTRIFFDPQGESIAQFCKQAGVQAANPIDHILFSFGPEADYSLEQKELLKSNGFIFYRLTPTVLRSCQVASLGSGILRSVFY